ncbi:MAG: Hsp20/alpha crystallin family protein [Pseudomonadota bacterium]
MTDELRSMGWWPSLYEPFQNLGARIGEWIWPASEAAAEEDVYCISAELPGVPIDDVTVSVTGDLLTITGEKKSKRSESGDGFIFSEIRYGAFRRAYRLPGDADPERIAAEMKDGVLNVRVERLAPKSSARAIPISS